MELQNKTGNYKVDDIDIYVFPDKIIIDTGNRSRRQREEDYPRNSDENDRTGKGEKKGDFLNDMLDNAQEFVMPGSTKKKR